MTTTVVPNAAAETTALSEHAKWQIGPSTTLDVEWVSVENDYPDVRNSVLAFLRGAEDIRRQLLECISIYLEGPRGENFERWKALFGTPWVFCRATEMTLGFVGFPGTPHLLRLWNGDTLIARVTSNDFDELFKLFHCIEERAEALCHEVIRCGYGPRGLLYRIS